jgi:plastocyanin
MSRPIIAATVLGAAVGALMAASVLFAQADSPMSTLSIHNFTFTPQTLTVKAGTTVSWINKDDIPHGIASSNNAFKKSRALDTDDNYSFTFTTPGTYQYFCYLHPHMVGSIGVEATTGSIATP